MTTSIAPNRFGAAEVRACSRHLATVVAIRGDVSAADLDAVAARVRQFVLPDTAFVLDLSELHSIPSDGVSLLTGVDDAAADADVEWALVPGPATAALFDATIRDRMLPLVDSVADALHDFVDARATQRTLLLPLLQRSA